MHRQVHHAEAHGWLEANAAAVGSSVVTSLPDISEMPLLGFDAWRAWFMESARRILRWVPHAGAAVFYQSDVRQRGVWVDKAYLVARAAEDEGVPLLWHTIVCRKPAGTATWGRASYAHMLCFARSAPLSPHPHADVLPDAGAMPWSRAMGAIACREACMFLRDSMETTTVVDPFCGRGAVLAAANALGMDAVGVDRLAARCRAARRATVT